MANAELRINVLHLLDDTMDTCQKQIDYCIYDDACHLEATFNYKSTKFKIRNNIRFYIDKLHIRNHTRPLCKTWHNMNNDENIKHLNSIICEQNFSLLLKYRFSMSKNHFNFFLMCIYNSLNEYKLDLCKSN